jgi:fatty acid desaturase
VKKSDKSIQMPAPNNIIASAYLLSGSLLTVLGIYLLTRPEPWIWISGDLILALTFLQWFVILHEAGHNTLFRSRILNRITGFVAGFFALIPYEVWVIVHDRHHEWTGWQDIDSTTADLVSQNLGVLKKTAVNFAWATGFPLFSVLYRTNNYWNYFRIRKFTEKQHLNTIKFSILSYLFIYILFIILIIWFGSGGLLIHFGFALFLSFMIQDPVILSQHTHIPSNLSKGQRVQPFPHLMQGQFTRSLRVPFWFSLFILHFDAHERHHKFVQVPGYYLRSLSDPQPNEVHWWTWLRAAKKLSGAVFLFQNSHQTGFRY